MTNRNGRSTSCLVATVFALFALNATSSHGDEISVDYVDWEAGKVIANVLKILIEKEYGNAVVFREGTTPEALTSMDAGDGKYDVFPDLWMPNQEHAWAEYVVKRQTIHHNQLPYSTSQGFFLPTSLADTYAIQSVEDLKRPAIIRLFDSDGDGLGEYWAGDEKWGATKINQVKMQSYGLSDYWEPVISSNTVFKTTLSDAMENELPILFYHWKPEWVFGAYKLSQLGEPQYFAGCDKIVEPEQRADWLAASSHPCAFADGFVSVMHSSSLETRFPEAAAFLTSVHFTPEIVSEWVTATGIGKQAPAEVAEAWIEKNQRIVDSWINDAKNLQTN